jgi:hypothetical protein
VVKDKHHSNAHADSNPVNTVEALEPRRAKKRRWQKFDERERARQHRRDQEHAGRIDRLRYTLRCLPPLADETLTNGERYLMRAFRALGDSERAEVLADTLGLLLEPHDRGFIEAPTLVDVVVELIAEGAEQASNDDQCPTLRLVVDNDK